MIKILEKYKLLGIMHKLLIWLVVFIVALFIFPSVVVFIAGTFISYFLINNKIWKYLMITIFCLATFVSVILLIPTDNPIEINVRNNDKNIPVIEDKSVMETNIIKSVSTSTQVSLKTYDVIKVVDGDTIDVSINGKTERIRLIGINTPETVDPRKPVECFGKEASDKAKALLNSKKVYLESDITQGELDKYNRLLRYVFLEDGTNFNLLMIKEGYAYEYTYNTPYKYQAEFKEAQKYAENTKAGLWGDLCQGQTLNIVTTPIPTQESSTSTCTIKGNISSTKEKIYHMIGCGSYEKTQIDISQGERMFCTEQEALDAGWRKALNCN